MIFSTKAEYGVRVMTHLAGTDAGRPVSLGSIAEAEGLPLAYLEHLGPERATLQVLPGSHRGPVDSSGARTLALGPGDLVVLDYRFAHATTANETGRRREAVLLNFAPRWRELPADLRGHLVAHLALPRPGEARLPPAGPPSSSRPPPGRGAISS